MSTSRGPEPDPGPEQTPPTGADAPTGPAPEVPAAAATDAGTADPGTAEPGAPKQGGQEAGAEEQGAADRVGEEQERAEPAAAEPGSADPVVPPRRRLPLTRIATVALCGVLGVALAAQLRHTDDDAALPTAREADLVRILDDLEAREERLRAEIQDLESRRRAISSSAQGSESALAEARRRATELGVLAGTVPARGPGLVLRFEGGDRPVPADVLLDAVEELRGAGAEAMQISGRDGPAVRIVASTYFAESGRGIEVDGQQLDEPYVVSVIGDPTTMLAALNIPGGVTDTVGQTGGTVRVDQPDRVSVTALRRLRPPRYAQPVP